MNPMPLAAVTLIIPVRPVQILLRLFHYRRTGGRIAIRPEPQKRQRYMSPKIIVNVT